MKILPTHLLSLNFWRILKDYTGATGGRGRSGRLEHPVALGEFLDSRASHVAQTALYGYMKTRAGTRFPALFDDPVMLASINIAKWQIWLACLSDLAIYSGILVRLRTDASAARIRTLLGPVVVAVLFRTGIPEDAGDEFPATARRVVARITAFDFDDLDALADDDSAFTESPRALVYWSPIADELKNLDVEIIRNSVRFRWQEVRRELRKRLRAAALVAASDAASAESVQPAKTGG